MQIRGIANPDTVLASGDVSLVMVEAYLRPGIQKGDHFDIELRVPSQSDTTSLRGGYLLETRLAEMDLPETRPNGPLESSAATPWRWPRARCWSIPPPTRRTASRSAADRSPAAACA